MVCKRCKNEFNEMQKEALRVMGRDKAIRSDMIRFQSAIHKTAMQDLHYMYWAIIIGIIICWVWFS